MELQVLGSSSSGNCYLLDNGVECLMIEAGVQFAKVKQAMDFDIKRIAGVIISHEHGDHAGHVKDCINANVPVYMSHGTRMALHLGNNPLVHDLNENVISFINDFRVLPFHVDHDANEPMGFIIYHHECGHVLFATDTKKLPDTIMSDTLCTFNNILMECNYQPEILQHNVDSGDVVYSVAKRITQSHCSLDRCIATLERLDLSQVNNVVLIHLSSQNADPDICHDEVVGAIGKKVTIARRGVTIGFNNKPF